MIASRNEPNARLPKLYLSDHQRPLKMVKLPLLSLVLVKYHVQTPTIREYLKIADRSSHTQNRQKTYMAIIHLISSLSLRLISLS